MLLKKDSQDYWEIVQLTTPNKRPSMEDTCLYLSPFTTDSSLFLSVFDGHAGPRCSTYLANTLPSELKRETQANGQTVPSEAVFNRVYAEVDNQWLEAAKQPRIEDGSTALCLALDGNNLTVANCGDCRAIFCQNGIIQQITRDHRPTDESEEERIVQAGGTVLGGRLQGQLGVSRAFGNYEFKNSNLLSSDPEIHHVTVTSDVEFLVVGTDGLYDHFSNEEIISFIKNGLINSSLENVVKELTAEAIDRGTEDNISIIVVKFEKAFKKLLKKRAKKPAGKSPLISGKSSPLRTSSKSLKHSAESSSLPETKTSSGLFKEVKKGLTLKSSTTKSAASPVHMNSPPPSPKSSFHENVPTQKKKSDNFIEPPPLQKKKSYNFNEPTPLQKKKSTKKIKTISEEEKWTIFSKPFKNDFFSRTAVTISG